MDKGDDRLKKKASTQETKRSTDTQYLRAKLGGKIKPVSKNHEM